MRTLVLCAVLFLACVPDRRACCRSVPQKATRRSSASLVEAAPVRRQSFDDNAKATVSLSSRFVQASGVFINREGDILTSLHAVPEGADPMHVVWDASDRRRNFRAESLYWSKQLDVLVLRSGMHPEHYARFAGGNALREGSDAYLVGRRLGNGVVKFYGRYLGDALPYAASGNKVSNYLLSSAMFSSGGGIFQSGDNSLIGINRLMVNEHSASAPTSGATIGDIKIFLRCHHINFEEVQ